MSVFAEGFRKQPDTVFLRGLLADILPSAADGIVLHDRRLTCRALSGPSMLQFATIFSKVMWPLVLSSWSIYPLLTNLLTP